jgi:hypothetical protein
MAALSRAKRDRRRPDTELFFDGRVHEYPLHEWVLCRSLDYAEVAVCPQLGIDVLAVARDHHGSRHFLALDAAELPRRHRGEPDVGVETNLVARMTSDHRTAISLRKPFLASCMAAAVQRNAIEGELQRFTLRVTDVGAGKRAPQLGRQTQPAHRQDLQLNPNEDSHRIEIVVALPCRRAKCTAHASVVMGRKLDAFRQQITRCRMADVTQTEDADHPLALVNHRQPADLQSLHMLHRLSEVVVLPAAMDAWSAVAAPAP